ncbi:hypothetical protein [Enterovirga sp.]|nr:hypothetical protein [Enterovirga sp.]
MAAWPRAGFRRCHLGALRVTLVTEGPEALPVPDPIRTGAVQREAA